MIIFVTSIILFLRVILLIIITIKIFITQIILFFILILLIIIKTFDSNTFIIIKIKIFKIFRQDPIELGYARHKNIIFSLIIQSVHIKNIIICVINIIIFIIINSMNIKNIIICVISIISFIIINIINKIINKFEKKIIINIKKILFFIL
jgi:hypothetical protein